LVGNFPEEESLTAAGMTFAAAIALLLAEG
jgi:hypothetical protein